MKKLITATMAVLLTGLIFADNGVSSIQSVVENKTQVATSIGPGPMTAPSADIVTIIGLGPMAPVANVVATRIGGDPLLISGYKG